MADLADDGLVFDALSYTWGNPVTVHERKVADPLAELQELKKNIETTSQAPGAAASRQPKVMVDFDALAYYSNHPYQPFEQVDWNAERSHAVHCNDRKVMVTQNLFEALELLRCWHLGDLPDPEVFERGFETLSGSPISRHIWIDMICINQEDDSERSSQVGIMGRIFSHARTVIGWLGPEAAQSRLAARALTAVCRAAMKRKDPAMPLGAAVHTLEGVDGVSTVALFALFQRLWFRRAWIVQEVVLARQLVLAFGGVLVQWETIGLAFAILFDCGLIPSFQDFVTSLMAGRPTKRILRRQMEAGLPVACVAPRDESWNGQLRVDPRSSLDFIFGVESLRNSWGDLWTPLTNPSNISAAVCGLDGESDKPALESLSDLLNEQDQSNTISLDHLLHLFRQCDASDHRDKVYSLVGILEQSNSPVLDIPHNYSLPVSSLYQATVESIIRASKSLNILAQVQDPSQTQLPNLPTWVPDFSVCSMPDLFGVPGQHHFSASGEASPHTFSIDTPSGILHTEGYPVDTIKSVAETKGCYFVRTGSIITHLPAMYCPGKPESPAAITRAEAYWRTLIADTTGTYEKTHPAPLRAGFEFADWVANKLLQPAERQRLTECEPTDEERAKTLKKLACWMALSATEQGEFVPLSSSTQREQAPQPHRMRFLPDMKYIESLRHASLPKQTPSDSPKSRNAYHKKPLAEMIRQGGTRITTQFEKRLQEVKRGHRMFRTRENYLGLGPMSTSEGDEVWILRGASVPFVLRRVAHGGGRYRVVGEAYVHGAMHGEVVPEEGGWVGVQLV